MDGGNEGSEDQHNMIMSYHFSSVTTLCDQLKINDFLCLDYFCKHFSNFIFSHYPDSYDALNSRGSAGEGGVREWQFRERLSGMGRWFDDSIKAWFEWREEGGSG